VGVNLMLGVGLPFGRGKDPPQLLYRRRLGHSCGYCKYPIVVGVVVMWQTDGVVSGGSEM
jgi:hypothetical protein